MTRQIVRIVLRYGVGAFFGMEAADMIVSDPDILDVVTAGAVLAGGVLTEWWYRRDIRKGLTK